MKNRTILSALILSTLGLASVAHAQTDWQLREQREWREQQREQREQQRRWRVEQQRQLEHQQRQLEQRQLGGTRFMPHSSSQSREHPTIDTRTQRLPPAPPGHEWQTAPNGDFMLVNSSTGVAVQLLRNITPQPAPAP